MKWNDPKHRKWFCSYRVCTRYVRFVCEEEVCRFDVIASVLYVDSIEYRRTLQLPPYNRTLQLTQYCTHDDLRHSCHVTLQYTASYGTPTRRMCAPSSTNLQKKPTNCMDRFQKRKIPWLCVITGSRLAGRTYLWVMNLRLPSGAAECVRINSGCVREFRVGTFILVTCSCLSLEAAFLQSTV